MNKFNALSCPVCGESIFKNKNTFYCSKKHCFDEAKEGYLNLLLSNQKHSKTPGDSKEMLISRKDFLNKGYYKNLSAQLNDIIWGLYESCEKPCNIVDIGCGEGYYLSTLVKESKDKGTGFEFEAYGIDISKDAIKLATKRDKSINWIVANVMHLPFKAKSIDIMLCMFSMINFNNAKMVLKKNGRLIFVSAGINHLFELRKVIYPEIHDIKVSELDKQKSRLFFVEKTYNLAYKTKIQCADDIFNLFRMTPHYWKVKEAHKKELLKLSEIEITVDVNIEVLKY